MKIIKIFIASSINEFKEERNELGRFISGINNKFIEKNIYCKLQLCENEDQAMPSFDRKQDEYNALIKDADAVFVLFFKKAGTYTVEEMNFAHDCFKENGSPKVYTYFKNFDETDLTDEVRAAYDIIVNKYQHFFGTFENVATIEVDILRTMFEISLEPALEVKVDSETVYLGSEPIMSADELDYIKNNKAIDKLKKKLIGLRSGDEDYTDGLYGDEIDDEIAKCEKRLKERYESIFKALEARYNNMSNASRLDIELQAAYNASAAGDYNKVLEILSRESLKNETQKVLSEERLTHKQYYETTFNKYLQRINALKQTDDFAELDKTYADAVAAIKELSLYKTDAACLETWLDYMWFLYDQNDTVRAIELGEGLGAIYTLIPDKATLENKADLWNTMGVLCNSQMRLNQVQDYLQRALDARLILWEQNPEKYTAALSTCYNNLWVIARSSGRLAGKEDYLSKAIKLRESVAPTDPKKHNPELSRYYANAASYFREQKDYVKAEDYCLRALKLRQELAADNPVKHSLDLALSYNSVGVLYRHMGMAAKAEEFYLKSINLLERLAKQNPLRYNTYLADSYNNIAILYKTEQNMEQAENCYLKAIAINEVLATDNPERYNPKLAKAYSHIGIFYEKVENDEKAEEYYLKAIALREKMPMYLEKHKALLEGSYDILAYFYEERGRKDEAELYYLKSVELSEVLCEMNPQNLEYFDELAKNYETLALLYGDKGEHERVEQYHLKALPIRESLAAKAPDKYNAELAVVYYRYGTHKNDEKYIKKSYEYAKTAMHDSYCEFIVNQFKDKFN